MITLRGLLLRGLPYVDYFYAISQTFQPFVKIISTWPHV